MKKFCISSVAGLLLMAGFFFLPRNLQAQSISAAIHGSVTDSTGAVVPGATVTATNTSTGISTDATTDGNGYYIFPQLQIGGPYTVHVSKPGFQDFQSTGLMLNVNANRDVDALIKVGSSSQTVRVNAAAVQVETSDTQLKTIIGANEIEELPLLGRNAIELQKTTPGVVEASDRFGNFSSNGSQTQQNTYLLDGSVVNDAPLEDQEININPDALAEFNVVTSTLNPEFARNSGAVLNEVLKSGTNQIHGSGFEFYRDTFLNNGSYFSATRPSFHQNDYGGTLGGPIVKNRAFFFVAYEGYKNSIAVTTLTRVPNTGQIAAGDFSQDTNIATNGTNAANGLSSNPIPFNIAGPNGPCVADPTAAQPETWADCFPNTAGTTIVPTSNYNTVALGLANTYVPPPNYFSAGTPYYNFNAPQTDAEDQGIIRLDFNLTKNDSFWASSVFQSTPSVFALPFGGSDLPGFAMTNTAHVKIFTGDWTHTFNPTTLNDLRAGYFRYFFGAVFPLTPTQPSSYGFTGITPQIPTVASAPTIGLTGLFTLGGSPEGPQPRHDGNYDFSDNFSKVAGNHNLKFGAHVERFSVSNPYDADISGSFGFNGTGTFSSGDPLIDFMLGVPDSYSQSSGGIIQAYAFEYYFYAQDNWKISNTFTVNYGIASDTETPYKNVQYGGKGIFCWAPTGQSTVFPTAPPGLLYPGDPGCNQNGGPTTKYDHFSPRVGFAWSPESGLSSIIGTPGAHQFAVRGGFGIYFNRDSEESSLQNLEAPPFGLSSSGAADVGGSPAFANPFQDVAGRAGLSEPNKFPFTAPASGTPIDFNNYEPIEGYSISPNYDVPYTYNFNLNVQRELPSDMVLQIGYVGSLGRKLIRGGEADTMTASGHAACVANPACVAQPGLTSYYFPQYFTQPGVNSNGVPYYVSIGRVFSNGASNYNALQVQLTKQATHGLYLTVAYTYSHALDNASGYESSFGGGGSGGSTVNMVPGYQDRAYGDSDYDARQRLVFLYNYEVPILHSMNENRIVREALGGWHVTGVTALQTGFPVGLAESDNAALWCTGSNITYFGCSDLPNTSSYHISTMNPRKAGNFWFNPNLFSFENTGQFGNTKRNFFHAPGYNYTDLSLYKNFPLGGVGSPRYIQLRLESYNTFNHPNFAEPDGNISTGPAFGTISNVIQPSSFGPDTTGDPQPGRAVQLAGKFYF